MYDVKILYTISLIVHDTHFLFVLFEINCPHLSQILSDKIKHDRAGAREMK